MSKKKSGKGRGRNSISPSVGPLTSHAELEHLDGLSFLHHLDVQSNWEFLNPEEAAAERNHAALLESYYFGGGGRFDLVANLWFGDSPGGISEALVMPGAAWKANVWKADDARRHWHDRTRTRTEPKGELSGKLKKVFCRLTPWNASAAARFLKREDVIEAVLELAILIGKETGLKVLGAVIHRETDHDIHVHFIVSKIGPVEIEKDSYSGKYIKKLTTKQRKIIREERRERGDDISLKAVNEDLAMRRKEGTVEDPTDRRKNWTGANAISTYRSGIWRTESANSGKNATDFGAFRSRTSPENSDSAGTTRATSPRESPPATTPESTSGSCLRSSVSESKNMRDRLTEPTSGYPQATAKTPSTS